MDELIFYYLAGVPLLGILAQWLAWRVRLPSILILLAFGVLLGVFIGAPDEVFSRLNPEHRLDFNKLLLPLVSLCVAVIMFEGGLTLKISELRDSGVVVLRLCTLGALISWLLTAVAAYYLLNLDVRIAAMIGAILVVTGPTVIAPLLRHIKPSRKIGSIVKWEGIVIDPVGAVLAVLVFQVITSDGEGNVATVALTIAKTIAIGGILGCASGWLLALMIRRYWIPDFLQSAVGLAVVLSLFAVSHRLQPESGLVTATVLGIFLANQKKLHIEHVAHFKEHLVVVLISCLFIVLGSRIEPSSLWNLSFPGLAFLAVLILIIRPLSIYGSTWGCGLTWPEQMFLAFLAPRGIVAAAVSSVFALEVAHHFEHLEGMEFIAEQAALLEPIAFLVIVGSVAVYGLGAAPLARILKLAERNPSGILFAGADPIVRQIAKVLHDEGFRVLLVDTNYNHVAAANMEGLEAECVSILSEHLSEESDLGGIGRLLAMTGNDEVNALAAREFRQHFGAKNVYQLAPPDKGAGKRDKLGHHLRGRLLFNESLTYEALADQLDTSHELYQIKATTLTEEFTWESYQNQYEQEAELLFLIDENRRLLIDTVEEPLKPATGQTVIGLTPGVTEPK